MKAIKITQTLKYNNPNLFKGNVGDIVKINPPKVFRKDDAIIFGYDTLTDQHESDGFKNIKLPNYDTKTQKLGKLIEDGNTFTYEVVDLTDEELDAKIPMQISKLEFKLRLLTRHNITTSQVEQIIEGVEDSQQKEIIKLLYNDADFFERDNPYLYQFAPSLGLTEDDIKNLFKDA